MFITGQPRHVEHSEGGPQGPGALDRRSPGEVQTGGQEQEVEGRLCCGIKERNPEGQGESQ